MKFQKLFYQIKKKHFSFPKYILYLQIVLIFNKQNKLKYVTHSLFLSMNHLKIIFFQTPIFRTHSIFVRKTQFSIWKNPSLHLFFCMDFFLFFQWKIRSYEMIWNLRRQISSKKKKLDSFFQVWCSNKKTYFLMLN